MRERGDLGGSALRTAAADDQGTLRRAQRRGGCHDGVFVDGRLLRRQRRLERCRSAAAPDIDGAFEHGGAAPPRCHRGDRLRHQRGGVLRPAYKKKKIDEAADDLGLVADFVQLAEAAPDVGVGIRPIRPSTGAFMA